MQPIAPDIVVLPHFKISLIWILFQGSMLWYVQPVFFFSAEAC